MLRIAVQSKGRLHDDTMQMLADCGVKTAMSKRALLEKAVNAPVEVLFLRDDDIPQCVADGVADVGIVGENELCERREQSLAFCRDEVKVSEGQLEERGERVEVLRHLGFSQCRLSLAVPKAVDYTGLAWFEGKKIATSYPRILERFLKEKGISADIHVITGSVEVSPCIGLSDAIFDIVSSGSTLVSNNLREVETVMHSDAVLIAGKSLSQEKRATIEELLFRIEAVMNAQDKKYVLMNVPEERLSEVLGVLPGAKSPTVMPLATPGWNSVHTVIETQSLWTIIGKLKTLGVQGILVVPIEKMVY